MEVLAAPHRPRRRKPAREPFVSLDLRQAWADRRQDLIDQFTTEIATQIGCQDIGAARRALVSRAASIALECERQEGRLSSGAEVSPADLANFTRVVSNLRRLLEALGIGAKPRKVA